MDPKDLQLVLKFKNRVTDVVTPENLNNNFYLIRWLRARDMDLEKAEQMLRKSMAWNKRNETESILTWKPVQNYYRYAISGYDEEGCPGKLLHFRGIYSIVCNFQAEQCLS